MPEFLVLGLIVSCLIGSFVTKRIGEHYGQMKDKIENEWRRIGAYGPKEERDSIAEKYRKENNMTVPEWEQLCDKIGRDIANESDNKPFWKKILKY